MHPASYNASYLSTDVAVSEKCEILVFMDENEITLRSYENHAEEFISGTPHDMIGDTKIWIDSLLAVLSSSAQILELGSGFGRDAAYMQEKGYSLELTDGAQVFVDLLKQQSQPVRLLNIVTDDLGGNYDMIFANAVFEHFPRAVLGLILEKIHRALKVPGLLGFSVREGRGEHWSSEKLGAPRYFCRWEAGAMDALLRKANFQVLSIKSSQGFKGIRRLYVIAKKTNL